MRILFAALLLTLTGCADPLPGTYDADMVFTQTGTSMTSTVKGTLTITVASGGYGITLEPMGSSACRMDSVSDMAPESFRLTSQSMCTFDGVKDTVKTGSGSGSANGNNVTFNLTFENANGTGTIATTGTRRK